MSKKSRDKGARNERLAAKALTDATPEGWAWERNGRNGKTSADIVATEGDGRPMEVKVRASLGWLQHAFEQADEITGDVMLRFDNGTWRVIVTLDRYVELKGYKNE